MKPAVLLLSGGLDSTTLLALATSQGWAVHALTFRYGQRHGLEVERARRIAESFGVARHVVAEMNLRPFGGSALTADLAVPKDRPAREIGRGIPSTYVPARNTIFLAYALAWAEVLGAFDLFIGVNALDYSGYPDCRPEYVRAFGPLLRLAQKPSPCVARDGGDAPHAFYTRLVNDLAIYGVGLARREGTLVRLQKTLEEYRRQPATFGCTLVPRRAPGAPRSGCA